MQADRYIVMFPVAINTTVVGIHLICLAEYTQLKFVISMACFM